MSRRSRREIARSVEDLGSESTSETSRAADWAAYIKGELTFGEYKARRGGGR